MFLFCFFVFSPRFSGAYIAGVVSAMGGSTAVFRSGSILGNTTAGGQAVLSVYSAVTFRAGSQIHGSVMMMDPAGVLTLDDGVIIGWRANFELYQGSVVWYIHPTAHVLFRTCCVDTLLNVCLLCL